MACFLPGPCTAELACLPGVLAADLRRLAWSKAAASYPAMALTAIFHLITTSRCWFVPAKRTRPHSENKTAGMSRTYRVIFVYCRALLIPMCMKKKKIE
jgi:hypothetical protein